MSPREALLRTKLYALLSECPIAGVKSDGIGGIGMISPRQRPERIHESVSAVCNHTLQYVQVATGTPPVAIS